MSINSLQSWFEEKLTEIKRKRLNSIRQANPGIPESEALALYKIHREFIEPEPCECVHCHLARVYDNTDADDPDTAFWHLARLMVAVANYLDNSECHDR